MIKATDVIQTTDKSPLQADLTFAELEALADEIRSVLIGNNGVSLKEYVKIAKQRIEALFEGILKIRPLGKKIYQPTGREKVSKLPPEWKEYQK